MLSAHAHLISYGLERGFTFSVFSGGECDLLKSSDEKAILEAAAAVGECHVYLYEVGQLRAIALVIDGDPNGDTVADCSDNMFIDEWFDAYEAAKAAQGE